MKAIIQHPRSNWQNLLQLSPEDGLTSNVAPADLFDSQLEEKFCRKWGDDPREGWRLYRECVVLYQNQKVFVPDFLFVHEDGRKVALEIVGFWTPEYLSAKKKTLAAFSNQSIIPAVADSADWPEEVDDHWTFRFKTTIRPSDVLAVLGRIS